MMNIEEPKIRITGALMPNYVGKSATLVGECHKTDPDGRKFTLKTTDNKFVQVVLNFPINQPLELKCITECYGIVQNNVIFQCKDFVQFPRDMSQQFDCELYNDFVAEFIKQHEKHFNIYTIEDHEGEVITPNDSFTMQEMTIETGESGSTQS